MRSNSAQDEGKDEVLGPLGHLQQHTSEMPRLSVEDGGLNMNERLRQHAPTQGACRACLSVHNAILEELAAEPSTSRPGGPRAKGSEGMESRRIVRAVVASLLPMQRKKLRNALQSRECPSVVRKTALSKCNQTCNQILCYKIKVLSKTYRSAHKFSESFIIPRFYTPTFIVTLLFCRDLPTPAGLAMAR